MRTSRKVAAVKPDAVEEFLFATNSTEKLWVQLDLLRHTCKACEAVFNKAMSPRSDMRCIECGMGMKDRLARAKKEGLHADQ